MPTYRMRLTISERLVFRHYFPVEAKDERHARTIVEIAYQQYEEGNDDRLVIQDTDLGSVHEHERMGYQPSVRDFDHVIAVIPNQEEIETTEGEE